MIGSDPPSRLTPAVVTSLDVTGAIVTAALLVMAVAHLGGSVRILLALAFVTFVPGWAAVGHLDVLEGTSRVALAVAVSLTLCTSLAQVLLWLRQWDTTAMLNGLGAVCLTVLVVQIRLARPFAAPEAAR